MYLTVYMRNKIYIIRNATAGAVFLDIYTLPRSISENLNLIKRSVAYLLLSIVIKPDL